MQYNKWAAHAAVVILLFPAAAFGAGQVSVMDPITKLAKYLKGGEGISINGASGMITATGTAVLAGSIPFENISSGVRGKYLGINGTSTNTNAYKGNSAPSATEFSYLNGVTAPIQGQISSVKVTAESKPDLSNVVPTMNGTGAAGTGPTAARVDHVHPSDTSREPANANIQAHISSTSNPHSVTKSQVGLGNVDNTSDANKPVSTATQSALNLKANTSALATVATTGSYTDLTNKPAVYTLPTASTTVKGGVKIDGTSIVVDGNGVISSTVSAGVSTVNGGTGDVTVTPENIGAATLVNFTNYTTAAAPRLAKADTALQPTGSMAGLTGTLKPDAIQVYKNGSGDRYPSIEMYSKDGTWTSRIVEWAGGGLELESPKGIKIMSPTVRQMQTAPSDAWNMYPAVTHGIQFPYLGVGSALQGFAQWLLSAGPTPAQVAANSNGSSWGLIGQEINTFERNADSGYKESTTGRWSAGIQMVPESELNQFGAGWERGYNGNFGIRFSRSLGSDYGDTGGGGVAGARLYPASKWHVPLQFETDCTTPTGTTILMKGGASAETQANKTIKATGYHSDFIDTSGATLSGSVLKVGSAQTFTDGTVTKTLAQLASGPFTAAGNTTTVATTSGTLTAGKQASFDASGNLIASSYDVGAVGDGGSGTVSSGTTGQYAYYSADGTAVGGHTPVTSDISGLDTALAGKAATTPSFVTIGTDAGLSNERVLTGTTNRVTVTDGGAGSTVTLTAPQDLHTSAAFQVGGLGVGRSNVQGTGSMTVGGVAAPSIRIASNSPSVANSTYLTNASDSSFSIAKHTTSGASNIDLDPIPDDTTSNASFRFFRNTNTSGLTFFDVLKGNNSTTSNARLSGNGDSYVSVDNGSFGVGTATPGEKLAVSGAVTLHNMTAPSSTTDRVKIYNVEGDYLHILDEDGNDHTIGQKTLSLGAASGGTATLQSTSHATKGLLTIPNDVGISGTLNNPAGVQTTSTTIDTAANQGATVSSSGATSLTITNVVSGRYFDFKVTSSGGGALSFVTLTPTWITGTPASIAAGKSSWFACKGTGANTADCVAVRENF